MKKIFLAGITALLAILAIASSAFSEGTQETVPRRYEPNWESLDTRPIPEWFNEAKFGIFVVWGPYSVPAWVHKGYAEWYGQRMRRPKDPAHGFHIKNYGADFKYELFAPMFKAELWDPDFWADLIEKSGAKYVALTVNYHDGFAMWPTKYSKTAETDKWNSMVVGPKRDIAGEFEAACTKKGIKFGIYYSLYEWFHPLWNADKERFAIEWMHPKFKDVVTKYKPWYIFLDGEWDADYKTWHSEELAAWLYNESPVKDYVVANDRWGKTRAKHGDVFSSEYGGAEGWADHPWEENRGMGQSYGYNRNENVYDYNSAKELLDMLTKCAMNGGNLLLDVGPTADGRIPVIMQERLLEIGQWLNVNGEAVYGTRRWKVTNEGSVRYTTKGNDVYAICTEWPGEELALKTPKPLPGANVTMLGCPRKIGWRMKNGSLHIDVPQHTIDKLPCQHAWVFKLPGAV